MMTAIAFGSSPSPARATTAAIVPVLLVLLAVATPRLVLPGGIPLRADDILAFGGAAWLLGSSIAGMRPLVPRDGVVTIMALTAVYILLDTARGSPVGGSVGAKEFLDTVRPLKFLAVYWLARSAAPARASDLLLGVLAPVMVVLMVIGMVQQFAGNSELALALSLPFAEVPEQSIGYLGYRAFGTFGTPADYAYLTTVVLLGAIAVPRLPARPVVAVAAVFALVLSGTRTFLFALPLVLVADALTGRAGVAARAKAIVATAVVAAIGAGVGLMLLSPAAKDAIVLTFTSLLTGDFEADDSIRIRLQNLVLLETTRDAAPWTGVVTRDFMRPEEIGGVDSEFLLTFHRYGLAGFALLLLTYWQLWRAPGAAVADPDAAALRRWGRLVALVTILYGVTQGALINTRVGIVPCVIIGCVTTAVAVARHREEHAT